MECNLLCSGPRKKSYKKNGLPTIGCNIPWTDVDYTIIFDEVVLMKIIEMPDIIKEDVKLILSTVAYQELRRTKSVDKLKNKIECVFKYNSLSEKIFLRSSGHYAAEWAIFKGFKKLNIYGCDNWFGDMKCLDNNMHNKANPFYIKNLNEDFDEKYQIMRGEYWKKSWEKMIIQNPSIEFNFVP
jgi:hypothetical protein